jgi:hypothetical protein
MTIATFATTTSQTTNSTLGLKLGLSVNVTLLQSGQAVNVTALIFNTLSTENNVSGASDWAIPSLTSDTSFPCPTYLYYQVYQGWYSVANISESGIMPLQVAPVYQYLSCPIFQRSYYLFQPFSDVASVPVGYFVTNSSVYYQPTEMAVSSSLVGNYSMWYNASIFTPNGALLPPPFPSGIYTIVAGDEWGQMVLLHFVVVPSINETVTSTLVSCVQSGPSQQVYIEIVSDKSNTPIMGANVSGSLDEPCGPQVNYPLQSKTTPSNGTVPLNVEGCACSVGDYVVIIRNGTASYQVDFAPPIEHLGQIVVVTIGIPSTRVIDMHITNSGVCTGNGTTIVNDTGFFC